MAWMIPFFLVTICRMRSLSFGDFTAVPWGSIEKEKKEGESIQKWIMAAINGRGNLQKGPLLELQSGTVLQVVLCSVELDIETQKTLTPKHRSFSWLSTT